MFLKCFLHIFCSICLFCELLCVAFKELDYYHSQVVDKCQTYHYGNVPEVSISWKIPLKTLIHNQPEQAHALIDCLIASDTKFASNNAFFYEIYLDLLKHQLNELTILENTVKRMTTSSDMENDGENVLKKHRLCCKRIHQLLTALDVQSLTAQSEIDELLMNLLYKVQSKPSGCFTKGSLYSALMSHRSLSLFRRFCDIETDYHLGNIFKCLSEPSPSPKFFVPSESLLSRTCHKDRPSAWKLFYLYARQEHHILEDVVVSDDEQVY